MFAGLKQRQAPAGPSTTCRVFEWVGQSFQCCDNCGRSHTEHPYRPTYGTERPEFYVKHLRHGRSWVWEPVKLNDRYSPARDVERPDLPATEPTETTETKERHG
jgi:hypothetical protein